ncbi:uncharacterized protein YceK [Pasteurella langaaensis DSM 22999]|uniref:Uncharacterized protein YceK n=2 Tax=Alitibacter langaaensis TaxID=756 RepID=A0A2U0TGG3_9PAST|nr:uncharacterized protein YceK [Pasteurella langaaensis DSM 22999]
MWQAEQKKRHHRIINMNMKKILLFSTALFMLNGCGTIVQLLDPTEKYHAYAGVSYDFEQAQRWGLPILDLPLSFLLDTALLPYVWSQE